MKFKPGLIAVLAVMAMLVQKPRALVCQDQESQNSLTPTVSSATDGIFAAFQRRPIVAIGDNHGLAQEEDFYVALVRDKRFAEEVGNVVVEFGDAAQQATLDRYLAGDEIPYQELRRVWSDTVGWIPTVNALGYIDFFAQVRRVNQSLPPDKRIKVWLGDPPIDWSSIKTKEDFLPKLQQRNQYPAELIKTRFWRKRRGQLSSTGTFTSTAPTLSGVLSSTTTRMPSTSSLHFRGSQTPRALGRSSWRSETGPSPPLPNLCAARAWSGFSKRKIATFSLPIQSQSTSQLTGNLCRQRKERG